jgi:hypothetical protein
MKIERSRVSGKRFAAIFDNGKRVNFGSAMSLTYIDGVTDRKRMNYIVRHKALDTENWGDPYSAGALSRWLLWEYRDLNKALVEYKKRFHL